MHAMNTAWQRGRVWGLTGLLLGFAVGCGGEPIATPGGVAASGMAQAAPAPTPAVEAAAAAPAPATAQLLGLYVGMFKATKFDKNKKPMYENKITVSVDSVEAGQIVGHSVVAGNSRPFRGTITQLPNGFSVQAREPGDDRYDGTFTFVIDPSGSSMSGAWKANDTALSVTERGYTLEKRTFSYNPALQLDMSSIPEFYWDDSTEPLTPDAGKFNASIYRLKATDIENMYKGDLGAMRNAIYARHGYSFKTRNWRALFDNYVPWYMPVAVDVSAEITPVEKANIELIKRYEAHAASSYDQFGR